MFLHFDLAMPIKLAADASGYAVSTAIAHILPDGSERPIAFTSQHSSLQETNYAQVEK